MEEPKQDLSKFINSPDWSNEQLKVLQQSVAKNTTPSELIYFANVCKSVGLNPFNKEIWCFKNKKGDLLIFTGRDGFLKKAQEHQKYAGMRSSEVCENDKFQIDIANNKITHEITTFERGRILGAYAIVFRDGGEPTIELVDFKTYNKGYNTWVTNPADMIKKVAEAHALKKAFGFTGVQAEEDWNTTDGEAIEPVTVTKEKVSISEEDFSKLMSNSNEYISKHYQDYKLTDLMLDQVKERLS
jgi:phage recombination protein Bet